MAVNIGVNIQRSPNRINQALRDAGVNGAYPKLLFDFQDEYYLTGGSSKTFANAMTFSRNGNATMVDSDGLIKWAPHNLLRYSNTFDNAVWDLGLSSTLTTAYAVSPSGSTDASRLQFPASGGTYFSQAPVFTAGLTYTYAIWAKATSADSQFSIYENTSGAAIQSPRKTATSEWQLFTFEFTASNTGSNAVGLNNENDSYATDILIYGAHLYRSDLGGMVDNPDRNDSYVPTTSSAVYLPRRGHHVYNGDTWVNKGVLVESEARTNLIVYSNDFSVSNWTGYWVKPTLTGGQIAPDGTNTAVKWNASTTTGSPSGNRGGLVYGQSLATADVIYTASVWLKASAPISLYFGLDDGKNDYITLTTEWVRYSYKGITNPTNLRLFQIFEETNADIDIYIWGAQTEAASTPSSYIPTNGASVTRAAETITVPYANLPWPTPTYIGDELVTNGTFDTDISGWTAFNSSTLSYSSGRLKITNGASLNGGANFEIATTAGKVYFVTGEYIAGTSLTGQLRVGTTIGGAQLAAGPFQEGIQTRIFVATGSVAYVNFINSSVDTQYGFIDNISVREINPLSVSIAMAGEVDYADDNSYTDSIMFDWNLSSDNYFQHRISTFGALTGQVNFVSKAGGVADIVYSDDVYQAGLNIPFNFASRHGSTFLNGAVDGISLTADTTPVALPDLSTTDLKLAFKYNGTISSFRMWDKDIGDTGIATATEPSLEASLSLTFDGQPSSYTNTGVTV